MRVWYFLPLNHNLLEMLIFPHIFPVAIEVPPLRVNQELVFAKHAIYNNEGINKLLETQGQRNTCTSYCKPHSSVFLFFLGSNVRFIIKLHWLLIYVVYFT